MSVCGHETNREQVCSCTSMTRGWQAISSEQNTLVKVTLTVLCAVHSATVDIEQKGTAGLPSIEQNVRMHILCLNTVTVPVNKSNQLRSTS